MLLASNQLLSSIHKITLFNNDNTLLGNLNNIITYTQLNKDIQSNLLNLIQNNPQESNYIKLLIHNNLIDFDLHPLEKYNIKFNNALSYHLSEIFNLKGFNSEVLREYYILNDFDYLNSKSKYNIKLKLISNLNDFKLCINPTLALTKLDKSLSDNANFKELYELYELFNKEYEKLFTLTMKEKKVIYNKYDSSVKDSSPIIICNLNSDRVATMEIESRL